MYSEQIEQLIEIALADGELTDKTKQVLFRRAEKEGIDLDEFEMVLNSRISKHNRTQPAVQERSVSDKQGDIKKCPACGAIAESYTTRCRDCDYNFNNIESNASIQKLFQMLNDAENERQAGDTSVSKAIGGLFAKSFGLGNDADRINNKKKEIIRNFPIPTTKEDILEFLSLALPNAKKAGNFFTSGAFNSPANERNKVHNEFVVVWKTKCEQIIMKARFSMKDDRQTLNEINQYASELGIK